MFEHDVIIITSYGKTGKKTRLDMWQAMQKARQEIMAQEDAEIFKALESVGRE